MNSEMGCSIICRACMKIADVLLPMYDDDMISKKNFPGKLADIASIKIDKYDGLPTVLCLKCAYRADTLYEFKLQVQATDRKLRKMCQISNVANISLKTDVICNDRESNGYSPAGVSSQVKLHSPQNTEQYLINTEEQYKEKVKLDVKPSSKDKQCEEKVCIVNSSEGPETINLVVDQIEENVGLAALQNLDHIFISDINDMVWERQSELQGAKHEIPDEIKNILQSDNLDYNLPYICNEESIDLDEHKIEHVEDELQEKCSEKSVFNSACNKDGKGKKNSDEKECLSEAVPRSATEFCNIVGEKGKWTTDISYDIIENNDNSKTTKPKCSNAKLNASKTANDDEDSDSDYFADPQDNLLGSLNDTIIRIKEIKGEGSEINYQCTLCMQNYDKLPRVLIHTVDNHVPSSGPFFCVVCEKDCDNRRDLRCHVKTHSGLFPYTCFICSKAYSMKRYLKRHMSCHTDFPRYRCPKCGKRFNVKTELETHVRTHIYVGAPFVCSQCPRVFNHKGNFKRHLISHLDPHRLYLPKYPCKVCGKRFLNNRTLVTHMRVHTGEKPFQCEVCSRSFSQQGNLLNHVRIHLNPRSYTCEVCGKRFNQRATLRDHSLLHTGEKPYVCNVCGVAFTFSAALRRHMWTHATDKPFGCEICNARFVGKYDMKRHMKIHTDRPKTKRRRNLSRNDEVDLENSRDETPIEAQISPGGQTIFIEHQVLLTHDSTQIVPREEAEKENVDALFNLIQYG